MKVRIKKIQLDYEGNPIDVKPKEIELIQEPTEDEHWQDVRERAAIAAMQGLIINNRYSCHINQFAETAVRCADALIKELKKKQS